MTRIYFDNASTSPIDQRVLDRMTELMAVQYGNPSSIHHHGRISRSLVEESRRKIATILGASIGEIFFTSSATEANNMILKNAVRHLGVSHIITSPTEHPCVLNSVSYLKEEQGIQVSILAVDQYGNPDLDQLNSLLQNRSSNCLVSIMHGNNEIGTVSDIKTIGELCAAHGALFHCDTVQSLGKVSVNVNETYFSFLCGSAHKFHGPKGVGFFYMNMDNIIPPYIHGGAQERNMRAGTENLYGIVGMADALEISVNEMAQHKEHLLRLRSHFKSRLSNELEGIEYNGNQEDAFLYHILSVSFPATDKADMLMFNLDISGISASSGSACSSGIEADSHVLVATGKSGSRKTIRFSLSKYNTLAEVDEVVDKLKTMTPVRS